MAMELGKNKKGIGPNELKTPKVSFEPIGEVKTQFVPKHEPTTGDKPRNIEQVSGVSLGDAISTLRGDMREIGQAPIRTFELNPQTNPVNAGDLRQLTTFPYEFSIHEEGGNIKVTTGKEGSTSHPDEIGMSSDTALYTHTHPESSSNVFVSFSDIFKTIHVGSKTQQVLVTREGIVVYKRPQFDPIRNIPTDESPRELMSDWGEQHGIDFFDSNPEEGVKSFFALSDAEKIQAARDFTRDTQMIVMDVGWDDKEGVATVLDAINQKTIITDNEAPKLPSVLDDLDVDLESLDLPHRATIEGIVQHIDYVKYKRGVLLRDPQMRQSWKEFAAELADEGLGENPPSHVRELLLKLKERAQGLIID